MFSVFATYNNLTNRNTQLGRPESLKEIVEIIALSASIFAAQSETFN